MVSMHGRYESFRDGRFDIEEIGIQSDKYGRVSLQSTVFQKQLYIFTPMAETMIFLSIDFLPYS